MTADPAAIAASLDEDQATALRGAMVCKWAGTYVGNCGAEIMAGLHAMGLFSEEPADGGGTWGIVARLNEHGLAVRAALIG